MSQKSDKLDLEVNQSCQPVVYTVEELECKICYNRYDTRTHKPKLLGCLHRVCAKCLKRIAENSSPSIVSCPFCRHETHVPDEEVWLLQDDSNILAILSYQDRARRSGGSAPPGGEVLLAPCSLGADATAGAPGGGEQSHSSSDCLVITIVEMPGESQSSDATSVLNMVRLYRPTSMASLPCHLPVQKCGAWTSRSLPSFLVGVLCLVYFSSLPLGIYLLMIRQLTLGVVLVSLVPSTLLLCVFYGFCQCLCQEIIQSIAT